MKSMYAVGPMLGMLAVVTLGAGTARDNSLERLGQVSTADCMSPAADREDYHVVHAIWPRPSRGGSGHVPRDSKIWM